RRAARRRAGGASPRRRARGAKGRSPHRSPRARAARLTIRAAEKREGEQREPLLPTDAAFRQGLVGPALARRDDAARAVAAAGPAREEQRPRQEDGRQVEPVAA